MAEKNIENVLVSRESMLEARNAIINDLANKKICIAQYETYQREGSFKRFFEIFKESPFAQIASLTLLGSILSIIVVLCHDEPALGFWLSLLCGMAAGSVGLIVAAAIKSVTETKCRMTDAHSRVQCYNFEIRVARKWLKAIDDILGVDSVHSDAEVTRLIDEKMAS